MTRLLKTHKLRFFEEPSRPFFTKEMEEAMSAVDITSENLSDTIGEEGLWGTIMMLSDAVDGDQAQLAKMFGSVEALNAVMMILNGTGMTAKKNMDSMTKGANELTAGFDKQNESAEKQYQLLKNNLNVALIDLGNKILPPLIDALKLLPYWLETIGEYWDSWTTALSKVFIAIDKVEGAMRKVKGVAEGAKEKIGGAFSGGWRGEKNIKGIPFFQEGGVVPGPVGEPTPAIVHGGETIIPAGQSGSTFNFDFSGAFIGNIEDFKRQLVDLMNRESELKVLGGV